jgi:ADP-heptose:LPS heptosyltransferase
MARISYDRLACRHRRLRTAQAASPPPGAAAARRSGKTALMASRFPVRMLTAGRAAAALLRPPYRRRKPAQPQRILVLHHLLLGDTLMLTALLKKLRERYPRAHIAFTCRPQFLPLYATRPYGVHVLPFDERDLATVSALLREAPFDLTCIPAENRLSVLARALGSRWVVGFAGDRPAAKNWLVDELRPLPAAPMAWCDMAGLLVEGPPPAPFRTLEWPQPRIATSAAPQGEFCVLHVGARSQLKTWDASRWRQLAQRLEARGLRIVLSTGPGENGVLDAIDRESRWLRVAGSLPLDQVWSLLARARLVVSLDNGIAHLARIVGVPLVVLFGGGSAALYGGGEFWAGARQRLVTVPDFPCRDIDVIFRRRMSWIRTCARAESACPAAKCMRAIGLEEVWAAADALLSPEGRSGTSAAASGVA